MTLQWCGEIRPHAHFRDPNFDNEVRTSFVSNRHRPVVALSPDDDEHHDQALTNGAISISIELYKLLHLALPLS
jgi:hypothetical protein